MRKLERGSIIIFCVFDQLKNIYIYLLIYNTYKNIYITYSVYTHTHTHTHTHIYIYIYISSLMAQTVKNLPAMQENLGLIPGTERSPKEGNDYPFPYFCLENSMDRGA